MDEHTYTIAGIAERLPGGKRRTVQFWADSGLLIPISGETHSGRGVHRVFSRNELLIAAAIKPLADIGMSIGYLATVAKSFRGMLDKDTFSVEYMKNGVDRLQDAVEGTRDVVCLIYLPEQSRLNMSIVSLDGLEPNFLRENVFSRAQGNMISMLNLTSIFQSVPA